MVHMFGHGVKRLDHSGYRVQQNQSRELQSPNKDNGFVHINSVAATKRLLFPVVEVILPIETRLLLLYLIGSGRKECDQEHPHSFVPFKYNLMAPKRLPDAAAMLAFHNVCGSCF
jgi:hypothetical protein